MRISIVLRGRQNYNQEYCLKGD